MTECTLDEYRKWIRRRAMAHVQRDRKRRNTVASVSSYKAAIHAAVLESNGNDAYTGEPLNWDLISKYTNDESKEGGRSYKKGFALLPTVDHVDDGLGEPNFVICSWRVNDAKNDLSFDEFVDVCRKVVAAVDRLATRLHSEKSGPQ